MQYFEYTLFNNSILFLSNLILFLLVIKLLYFKFDFIQ